MNNNEAIPPLYHYTKPGGFLGMVTGGKLWLSHINYQNDSKEFYHALDLINDVLEKEYGGFNIGLDTNIIYPVYTFSLTSEKDLLSQWRGYCPNGGYSFSINQEQLLALTADNQLQLIKCIYNRDEKVALIKDKIIGVSPETYATKDGEVLNQDNLLDQRHEMHTKYLKIIHRNILNYAAIMKHESFKEEQEWRIVTLNVYDGIFMGPDDIEPNGNGLPVNFREGNSTLIPYLQASLLNEHFGAVSVTNVVIGPTPNPMLAKAACELLLKDNPNIVIENSQIPYRNW